MVEKIWDMMSWFRCPIWMPSAEKHFDCKFGTSCIMAPVDNLLIYETQSPSRYSAQKSVRVIFVFVFLSSDELATYGYLGPARTSYYLWEPP